MEIKMLEAVSLLLKESKEIKVQCGRTILDKIIEGMKERIGSVEKDPIYITNYKDRIKTLIPTDPNPLTPTQKSPPPSEKKVRVPNKDEVEITVDLGRIKSIKNAKDDTMIQLDGRAMPWKEAIGKKFTEGKVL